MKSKIPLLVLGLILIIPTAVAQTNELEDFEDYVIGGFTPMTQPSRSWYTYSEAGDIGVITNSNPPVGAQSLELTHEGSNASSSVVSFSHGVSQPSLIGFYIEGATPGAHGEQSHINIQLLSFEAIPKKLIEFNVVCRDESVANDTTCRLHVRTSPASTLGDILIDYGVQSVFKIEVFPDWIDNEFCLEVDDIDDGCFGFLEGPRNYAKIRMEKGTPGINMHAWFDNYDVDGVVAPAAAGTTGDMATGLINFANDIGFNGGGSLFVFGLILLITCVAFVAIPMKALTEKGTDIRNSPKTLAASAFVALAVVIWLSISAIWPDWIIIVLIIVVAAIAAAMIRQTTAGAA